MSNVTINRVRDFWDANPLCATMIPHAPGAREYFAYYDQMREAIESVDFSYQLQEYKSFAGKRVLDVGSGNGYVLSKYAAEGAQVSGVDITPTGIELCNKRFEYLGLKGDFRVADAENLPFDNDTFDCVCSMGVLHHVPDTEKAVSEIFRVLKPGGRLIVMFYHRNSCLYRINYPVAGLLKGKSVEQLANEFDGAGNPKGAVYSKKELSKLLRQFEPLEMSVGFLTGPMVFPLVGRFIPDFLLRYFAKWWGWNLYCKGRKPLA